MLRIERLSSVETLDALEADWDALTAGQSPYVPFRSHLWNRLWWTHFRRDSALVRDDFFVHLVRDERDRLLAVAPLMLTRRGVAGVSCIRMLQFFGADPFMTELRGPICRPENQRAVVEALSAGLGRSKEFDWIGSSSEYWPVRVSSASVRASERLRVSPGLYVSWPRQLPDSGSV